MLERHHARERTATTPRRKTTPQTPFPSLSMKEVPAALVRSAQALRRALPVFQLQLVGHGVGDDVRLVVVLVVERELLARGDVLHGEEGELVQVRVGVVVRHRVDGAVGLT